MSELKVRFIDDTYVEYYNTGKHDLAQVYIKSEADKVIAELKAREDVLVTDNRNLLDKVKKLEERLHENAEHFKRNEAQIIENADKEIAGLKARIAELEEELEASKRKEKESRELADPYTLYCEASAESLRKALGEYRWRRPCDDLPPEWSCVIVYFHDEECREEQYRLAVYSKENGWEVDDEEVYKTAEIEAWHPLPMPPEEEE